MWCQDTPGGCDFCADVKVVVTMYEGFPGKGVLGLEWCRTESIFFFLCRKS